jgi:putative endonuclease
MQRQYYVYIITNKKNNVLYTGVTNDLRKRVYEHKNNLVSGFTKRYNISKLVYYEVFENVYGAITREKKIKAESRQKKINLIKSLNPKWDDLYDYF